MMRTGNLLVVFNLHDGWTPAIEWASWLLLRNWIVPAVAMKGLPSEM